MTSDLVVETLATDPKRGDIHLLVALTSLRPKGHLLTSNKHESFCFTIASGMKSDDDDDDDDDGDVQEEEEE